MPPAHYWVVAPDSELATKAIGCTSSAPNVDVAGPCQHGGE
jgi:hypothetical protein